MPDKLITVSPMDLPLVIGGIPIIPIDFSEPPLAVAMRALSLLGTIPLVTLAASAFAIVLFLWRRKTSLMLLVLTVGGGELISLLLKWLFVRPRPPWPDPLVVLTTSSFPSGHAMRSVLFYGILIYFLLPRIGSWLGRVGILLTGGGLVLMIGASRIYLEAHTLSDVLAGYAAGMTWLGCAIVGTAKIHQNRRKGLNTSIASEHPNLGPAWTAWFNQNNGLLLLIILIGAASALLGLYWASPSATTLQPVKRFSAPYPPSSVIERIGDFGTLKRVAPGSDLWATTWADDGNLYTSWGDGGGFGGSNRRGRVSMGVAQIQGQPEAWKAVNVCGGLNPLSKEEPFLGKAAGILSVGGVLYMSVSKENVWTVGKIAKSTDYGRTWTSGGWDFNSPFAQPGFLNFEKDYRGSRDQFVYSFARDLTNRNNLILARVAKDQIPHRVAYEFFSGLDKESRPTWVTEIDKRKPVFTDQNGIGWGVRAVYNARIDRYLLTVFHGPVSGDGDGSWGIFDAPEPWGPWTTVAYYTNWIDAKPKFSFEFPSKWISSDGKILWMIFSGTGFTTLSISLKLRLLYGSLTTSSPPTTTQ